MTKKYALSLALLGSLGLSYPVLSQSVMSQVEFNNVTDEHLNKHHVLRDIADKLKKAKNKSECHDILNQIVESKTMTGVDYHFTQDGTILASTDERFQAGSLFETHGPVYGHLLEVMRNSPNNTIEVVNGKDADGNAIRARAMRAPTKSGTIYVVSTESLVYW